MLFASVRKKKIIVPMSPLLKYIHSCTTFLASECMKKKKISASFFFDIKKASFFFFYRYGLKRVIINNIKKKTERQRSLMRFLEISLFFNGLFDYFSQLQTVNFIGKRSTVPAESLQAVSQQFTVPVEPPGFIHHLVQLLILVLSCLR